MAIDVPRFSVILPTHDRLDMLREAIESVARQTSQDWELIVVDDASKCPIGEDELHHMAGDKARLLRLASSHGGAGAKTAGAAAAGGQVLAFLDDDDLWYPEYLARANQALADEPEVRVLFMGVSWFGERGRSGQEAQDRGMAIIRRQTSAHETGQGVLRYGREALFSALLERVPMPFQRPVVYRQDYQAIGGYRPECLLWDCDWALRAVLHGECALLEEGLYRQRASGQGYSSQGRRALEHTRSNLEIKTTLLSHPEVDALGLKDVVTQALHRGWKGYAWQLRQQGERLAAFRALGQSARYGLSMEWVRMLLSVALSAETQKA
ncbi:MAG: glycosyltransferase family 2 protein [Pseudomonadales bacterium]|nr:glycosyltransferase family 2 protein [Pseudomonadales bacterium]